MTAANGRPPTGDTTRAREAPAAGATRTEGAPAAQGTPAGEEDDTVAAVVRQWRALDPGLDTGPIEIIGRINRCAALLQQAEEAPLRRVGLTRSEFDLLGALRRTRSELTPGEVARETFASGAAVTKRLRHLTERGLVERRGDPRDRRVAHLRLTDAGRALVDGVLPEQLAYERSVLSGLGMAGQTQMAHLLGELLRHLEGHPRARRT
ncbi:MAG TPA: MarR family transcriptional regulator [Streptomyces sp.]|nr:MarR family transcriptional regulator [Streptomyces sp.]